MRVPRPRAGHRHAIMAVGGPLVNHRVGDFGMKLQREGAAETDRLHFEYVAFGKELGAVRHVEALAVPLIDAFRPGLDHREPGGGRPYRVIADLGMAARMAVHLAAKKFGANLRAEADAEKRLVVAQRHTNPFDFTMVEIVAVIDAHRTAENDRGRMLGHGRRQGIAEARPPHVQVVAELLQGMAKAAGRGVLLVQDDQDRMLHRPIKAVKPCTLVTAPPHAIYFAVSAARPWSTRRTSSACGTQRIKDTAILLPIPAIATR